MRRSEPTAFSLATEMLTVDGLEADLLRPIVLPDCSATVDIWCVTLQQPNSAVAVLATLLSADERAHANRFVSPSAFRRFTVRRAARRLILSRYSDRPADALTFGISSRGQPILNQQNKLHFSCSASAELALIGVTNRRRLGIDVEQLRAIPDAAEIANRFFTRRESKVIARATPSGRSASFLRFWTCKEAWAKAAGTSLSYSLANFEVDNLSALHSKSVDGNQRGSHRWLIRWFVPAPGFVGAVVVESPS